MNTLQIARQIKHLIQAATWGEGLDQRVLASTSIRITDGVDEALVNEMAFPFCAIVVPPGDGDAEEPVIRTTRIQVSLLMLNAGDRWGEAALIGSTRNTDSGSTANKGLAEIMDRLEGALADLDQQDGIQSVAFASGGSGPVGKAQSRIVSQADLFVTAVHEQVRSYPPVQRLRGTAAGGTATLTWIDPPNRFDRKDIYVERVTGSVTSFTRGSGTVISSSVAIGTQTLANTPAAGTYTYGVWGGFDEQGSGTRDRFSSRGSDDKGRFVTVTV